MSDPRDYMTCFDPPSDPWTEPDDNYADPPPDYDEIADREAGDIL